MEGTNGILMGITLHVFLSGLKFDDISFFRKRKLPNAAHDDNMWGFNNQPKK